MWSLTGFWVVRNLPHQVSYMASAKLDDAERKALVSARALETIRRAAILADHRNLGRIQLGEVKKAAREANRLRLEYLLSKLNRQSSV